MTEKNIALYPLDAQLCFSVYSASIAINRMYRPILEEFGLTYPQYLVLYALWEQDGQMISAIADKLALESSTITPLVKRLETAGLVKRGRNPADERQVLVTLTLKGSGLQKSAECLGEALLKNSGMAIPELIRLTNEIKALRDALTLNSAALTEGADLPAQD